ncbi:hypothetical protein NHQ30_009630 [Ciborinia camelliae]|nr:hypothetical protein NHQ30_009630 [Ciborinia camelliae]
MEASKVKTPDSTPDITPASPRSEVFDNSAVHDNLPPPLNSNLLDFSLITTTIRKPTPIHDNPSIHDNSNININQEITEIPGTKASNSIPTSPNSDHSWEIIPDKYTLQPNTDINTSQENIDTSKAKPLDNPPISQKSELSPEKILHGSTGDIDSQDPANPSDTAAHGESLDSAAITTTKTKGFDPRGTDPSQPGELRRLIGPGIDTWYIDITDPAVFETFTEISGPHICTKPPNILPQNYKLTQRMTVRTKNLTTRAEKTLDYIENNPAYGFERFGSWKFSIREFRTALEEEFPNDYAQDIKDAVEEYMFDGLDDGLNDGENPPFPTLYSLLANIQHGNLKLEDALPKMNVVIYHKLDMDSFTSLIEYASAYKAQKTPESQEFLTGLFEADRYVMKELIEKEIKRQNSIDERATSTYVKDLEDDLQLADVFATILPDIYYNLNGMTWEQVLEKFNRQFGCQISLSQLKTGVQPLIDRKIIENNNLYGTTISSGDLLSATVVIRAEQVSLDTSLSFAYARSMPEDSREDLAIRKFNLDHNAPSSYQELLRRGLVKFSDVYERLEPPFVDADSEAKSKKLGTDFFNSLGENETKKEHLVLFSLLERTRLNECGKLSMYDAWHDFNRELEWNASFDTFGALIGAARQLRKEDTE